jgi:hypothetical protein
MSFLAPLFLFGALAVAAPIIFHLIRRTSREKIPFSSLMFLQPTPPRVTRSSKLENIFLLLLRCLVLGLLALGFSRPFFQRPVAADNKAGEGKRIVVLVDASASMKRDDLWSEARSKAERILRSAVPADSVAVYLFDRAPRPLMTFEQWTETPIGDRPNVAAQRLASAAPSWSSTHLGNALLAAVDALEDSGGRNQPQAFAGLRRIVVITDLQEGARLDGLQGFEWPRGIEVVLESLKAKRPTNAGLQLLLDHDEGQKPMGEAEIKIRVGNAGDSKREQFHVGWVRPGEKGFAGAPVDAYVPPAQSRVLTAPKPIAGLAAEQLRLTGDDEDFDNTVYLVPPKPEQIKVLFQGDDTTTNAQQSLYYLRRAFPETRRQIVQVIARPASAPLTQEDAFSAPLLIVADVLSDDAAKSVRAFLDSGKPVLFVMKSIAAAKTLADMAGLGSVSAEEAASEAYALLGQIEFEHPLFAPFADPRFSDFTKIHFWKHRRLDPAQLKGARVLARFDKGDPALLQVPVGKGLLFILTAGWHPADSQLALSSKFVPLLYSLLDLSGGVKAQLAQYAVGDPVLLSGTNAAQTFTVRKPDGAEVKVSAGERFNGTDQPGIYVAVAGASSHRFAVNLDAAESRTAPLPVEELERLKLPLKVPSPELVKREEQKRLRLHAAELEQRQKLWRWLIVSALVVLVMETWLAGWLTRRNQVPAPAATP